MRIALIVEGKTEKVFLGVLRSFLEPRLEMKMPKFDLLPYDGRIPTGDELKRSVERLLGGRSPADHVIALTDVYTGTNPPVFKDAAQAKQQMKKWVGNEPRFHPHAAQHDFEAWLLPYWDTIQKLARHNANMPSGNPESVNHNNPPSRRIKKIFESGGCRKSYVKPRDALRILKNKDLLVAVKQCSELKAMVNTVITVCDGTPIP